MRGRFSATIARSVKVLFLVAVVSGVTFSIRHAETQQPSVATPQSMDEVLPRVAEPSSVRAPAVFMTPESPASQTAWHAVGEWKGNGNTDTERFTIGGSEWRVSWRTTGPSRRVCALGVYVYDSSGAFVTLAALRQGVASDVSYVQAQPGEYYLSVMSCAADWEIAVEDCY